MTTKFLAAFSIVGILAFTATVRSDEPAEPAATENCNPPPDFPPITQVCPEKQKCCSFVFCSPPYDVLHCTWYHDCCDEDKQCEIGHTTQPPTWYVICAVFVPPEGS